MLLSGWGVVLWVNKMQQTEKGTHNHLFELYFISFIRLIKIVSCPCGEIQTIGFIKM